MRGSVPTWAIRPNDRLRTEPQQRNSDRRCSDRSANLSRRTNRGSPMSEDFKGSHPVLERARHRRAIDAWCQRVAGKFGMYLLGYVIFGVALEWTQDIQIPGLAWAKAGLALCCALAVLGVFSLLFIAPAMLYWAQPMWSWIEPEALRYGVVVVLVLVASLPVIRMAFADSGPMRGVMDGEAAEREVSDILAQPWIRDRGYVALENMFFVGTGRRGAWSRELDHVLIGPAGVIVIETKSRRGKIKGTVDAPEWRHKREGGSVTVMRNPLLQLRGHVRTVRELIGESTTPIHALCVIANASIDKALHPSVTTPAELDQALRTLMEAKEPALNSTRVTEITRRLYASRSTDPVQWAEHLARSQMRASEHAAARTRRET
ncbi:NERD domain-containing protein [Denitromonas ohlonensis]|uniref:NERD domain-containing protein n=3 Tax=Denitromonas TaxID=139331 RepID=A0A557REK6_9RHOO|nr:NERD domain-containing protein [Denitromonas ohlonensis]TVO75455.1 NERD domain-containing protein [Denitromonas ohlonensis]